ncbi:hypothetical protein ACLB2K_076757 [Fragaria x ananassa]
MGSRTSRAAPLPHGGARAPLTGPGRLLGWRPTERDRCGGGWWPDGGGWSAGNLLGVERRKSVTLSLGIQIGSEDRTHSTATPTLSLSTSSSRGGDHQRLRNSPQPPLSSATSPPQIAIHLWALPQFGFRLRFWFLITLDLIFGVQIVDLKLLTGGSCPAMSCMSSSESILIYLSVSGSIESVKLRIQTYKGFVVKKQKLVCGGRELARSNSILREYGVSDGNVMHLVLRLSDLQEINVRTNCGKEFTFHVERGKDVGYVKQRIAKNSKEFVDLEEQEVVLDGKPLEDQKLIDDICKQNDGAYICWSGSLQSFVLNLLRRALNCLLWRHIWMMGKNKLMERM